MGSSRLEKIMAAATQQQIKLLENGRGRSLLMNGPEMDRALDDPAVDPSFAGR
jgi:hypothetical protein